MKQDETPVPPGTYEVQMISDNKVRIVEGPYKDREIFLRLPTFKAKIEQETIK